MTGDGGTNGDISRLGVTGFTTIMMSGSWRRRDRRPTSKVRPAWVFTWVWLMPSKFRSTGSSMVAMLTLRLESISKIMYKVVVLPLPVGPVM